MEINIVGINITLVEAGLLQEWKDRNILQKWDIDLRQIHLEERAQLYASISNTDCQTIIQNIQNSEAVRSTFRKIKAVVRKTMNSQITKIMVPQNNGMTKTITEVNDIYREILQNTQIILTVGHDTLPESPYFHAYIGDHGEKDDVKRILEGEPPSYGLSHNPYGEELIFSLKVMDCNDNPAPLIAYDLCFPE